MMENNKWYILQVQTGLELDVQKELLRRGVEAVVPIENRQIHRAKQWISKQYIVFSGYVFIRMMYSWSQYYILSGINGVIRLLGGGKHPEALTKKETEWILKLSDLLNEPSVIKYTKNGYEVISGVLLDLKDNIIKLDRHAHRAYVRLHIAGQEQIIKLSYIIQDTKQTLDNNED